MHEYAEQNNYVNAKEYSEKYNEKYPEISKKG